MKPLPPAYWQTACAELAAADPVMAALIARYPDCVLGNRGDPFQTLARAIIGQQISVKAADSVWTRFAGYTQTINPEHIATLEPEALTACGLSRRKAEYLVDLAGHFIDGRIVPARWKKMEDEA
ncbi:MAG TPA: DNA-3-methyladenine glycosylase 2 family protein, partial [Thiobacillus sp.]|nr:DNA-3-methyladenine glycosylase 2 family protein [Thiobacillus sp.]